MDEVNLWAASNKTVRDSCVIVITESWLHPDIPDASLQLDSRTIHRQDRNKEDSGKTKGGGLCLYIHNSWCTNSRIINSYCSPDVEAMTVKCRPLYLPREFTVVILTTVYIPPDANISTALAYLHTTINKQQKNYPDGVQIIAGDFNKACLKTVFPEFTQYVTCATRGNNTLDHVYSNIKHAYKAIPLPHLGLSDHLSLFLIPAYTPLRRKTKPEIKFIKTWPEGALDQLQDCFSNTNWNLFEQDDLEEYTKTVLFYISTCVETVTVNKRIRIFPNQKPWMNKHVQSLLRTRDKAFRSGDRAWYNTARAELRRGIKEAKQDYKKKIEDYFTNGDPRQAWQGIKHITNYKSSNSIPINREASLAEELNCFFARFELNRSSDTLPLQTTSTQLFTVQECDVKRVLRAVNAKKAAGPDGVPGKVLKACADQLAGVFTNIFNLSLTQATVPSCLKTSIIIPVPKKPSPDTLNDYRPVALTPIIMKCFERLVLKHIQDCLPLTLDPHQFAYRSNRSTEDAIAMALHAALNHLEHSGSYVRMLFVDYSSAFNTIIPDILIKKLLELGLSSHICCWIKDFLTNRPQTVRLGSYLSSTLALSTGSPQGCVLSPLLYSLYTYDCTPSRPTNSIIKFADDTTVVGLISGGDETDYRSEVLRLVSWCKNHNLTLNIKKTKELIIDFRRGKAEPLPLYINGDCVERVHSFKFLGTHISDNLTWSVHTMATVKKAQQRLHFLRLLKKSGLGEKLLVTFYHSTIESILAYCVTVWYAGCSAADKKMLQRVINTAQKIIGCSLSSLEEIVKTRLLSRALKISTDRSHPGYSHFELLPSGRRYRCLKMRTNRLRNSFFSKAVIVLNQSMHL